MVDDGPAMTGTSTSTTRRAPLPALRAAVFAIVGTVLGVSAHHLVAGGPAPWRQSALAALVLFAVGLVGARRPRSLVTVVATCGTAQTGLHLWLMTAHAHGDAAAPTHLPGHPHHDAHEAWQERLHDSVTMTAVHVVAAFLVAVLLHRADTVCWALAQGLTTAVEAARTRIAAIRAVLLDGRPVVPRAEASMLVLARLELPPPERVVLADMVVRRGPPRAGFAHAD